LGNYSDGTFYRTFPPPIQLLQGKIGQKQVKTIIITCGFVTLAATDQQLQQLIIPVLWCKSNGFML